MKNTISAKVDPVLRLTKKEVENPQTVFVDFISHFHLHEIRDDLWKWLCAAITSDNVWVPDGYSRSNLVFLYENLEKLIEAVYVVYEKPPHKKREGKPSNQK
ncbi:hypothetical protein [Paraflavitalea sp. CAU 1676]|uniref:hypothetical protein n=1 Tax=Paraflavitalea sp. CAU 1676 TaxID=3032598 RepID=UPI0023DC176D|nr:hypothetical protein [Paraflavitalea sp. CAU 1676]MDF2190545.1 hypothetical protein [Paraflavitalea sp. CAU 1676]